jgi:P27 family predicted phage terminase small subunit
MAGRKPKPTQLKELNGNPGKRPLNRNEPKFSGTPTCPKHLDKVARAEWKRLSAELTANGLLTTVDRAALAGYCSAWARWVAAELKIQTDGTVINSPKSGYPIQNPHVGIANTALDQMRKFAVEFGMTPSSRSRINVADAPTSGDPFAEFMASIGGADEIDVTTDADAPTTVRATST